MAEPFTYPFGQPVRPRTPIAAGPRRVFVLGAYPSALHVKWTSPDGTRTIRALPVDDEPEPFWTGEDETAPHRALGSAAGSPHLPSHPSESAIVKRGKEPARLAALNSELTEAAPETVITLGNAAAAVFAAMLNLDDAPQQLQTEAYGEPITLPSALTWWPLAHPGAVRTIPKWRDAHAQWKGTPTA